MQTELQRRRAEFVDRTDKMELFCRMLESDEKHIMSVWGDAGMGKTSLRLRMVHECAQRKLRKAEVECGGTRTTGYLAIMRKIRDDVGLEYFNPFSDYVNFLTDPNYQPKISLNINVQGVRGVVVAGACPDQRFERGRHRRPGHQGQHADSATHRHGGARRGTHDAADRPLHRRSQGGAEGGHAGGVPGCSGKNGPLLSLCAHGNARFRLQTPGQRSGGPKAISYQPKAISYQPKAISYQSKAISYQHQSLDYTLVAVKERALSGEELASQGWSQLIEAEGKVIIGEAFDIIQHPNSEPKQLALRQNELIDVLANHLHYRTDTAPGSSGSPVYNDQWELVALHHSGVPGRDADGNLLTKDGTLWGPQMGEHRIDWIANEGVRVSRIIKDVKAQPLGDVARRLRDKMFSAAPPSPLPRPPETTRIIPAARQNGHGTPPAIRADGSAIWTIPLEISVNLGHTAPPVPVSSWSNAIATPAIITDTAPPGVARDNTDLMAALSALRASETLVYYDAEADAQARDEYCGNLPSSLTPAERFQRLHNLLRSTHTNQLGYKPAVHLYLWVDLHPNRNLRSIYSGHDLDPEELIREDLRIEHERASRLREFMLKEAGITSDRLTQEVSLLEDANPFNFEHVVPQSWFDKRHPMKGDLHHLFACESGCNSFRGNIPYFDFADFEEIMRSECGKRKQNRFEPSSGKGAVARATLYFLLRYPDDINRSSTEYTDDWLAILLRWHNDHPVEEYERHRNAAIEEKQGNPNPLIDSPELASQIDFSQGLG